MKRLLSSLSVAVLLLAGAARAAGSSLTYGEVRKAVVAVAGDFARSDEVRGSGVRAIRVKPVVNRSRMRPEPDRIERMFRDALSVYRTVTVAGDAAAADLILTPEIRDKADGTYTLSVTVSDASTRQSVWTGESGFGEPNAAASPSAAPSTASSPVARASASAPGVPAPAGAPTFVPGAARTWDEWFDRGIKSVGYHRAGSSGSSVRTRVSDGPDPERGFMGHTCFEPFGRFEFVDKHDFHKCHHGKGGNGMAYGGAELRLNVWEGLDLSLSGAWGQSVFLSDETLNDGGSGIKDGELETWFAEARAQWSFAPGAILNPYIGAGVEYTKAKGTLETDSVYYYTYEWTGYGWREDLHAVSLEYEDKSSSTCGLLNAGLELNLGSRFSLRGDFTYYAESHGEDSVWADCSRKVFSLDARLRFAGGLYAAVGGSYMRVNADYDEDGKTKMLRAGLGWRF